MPWTARSATGGRRASAPYFVELTVGEDRVVLVARATLAAVQSRG
ncbi:MAG TPA: hypothetical protein VFI21_02860 [Nocardioides sp.]|jgi:hypothetical protein|nr:hypothetical protein [Nocardioides sp.]